MKIALLVALATILLAPQASAQTLLHYDWGGVSTRAGNVWIHSRRDGTVTTSIRVGKKVFHNSNRGGTGVSYDYPAGRLDAFSNVRTGASHGWYTPRIRTTSPFGRVYPDPFPNPLVRWYPGLR